jgi:membrane fusion protein (multidrug efflux system)
MIEHHIGKSSGTRIFLWTLAVLAAVAGCSEQEFSGRRETAAAVPVRVVQVQQRDLKESVRAVGSLAASEEVTIRPEIPGIVKAVRFREGAPVARGELLFLLEDDEIRGRLEARRAALKAAGVEARNARKMLLRRRELLAGGIIARETFDEVKTAYESAAARRERLQAEIGVIQAQLRDTEIRSPIDGFAGAQLADPGDFVDAGDPLVTLVRTDPLEIEFTVAERHANRVREGQAVAVRTAADSQRAFEGSVFFVSPKIRESTRTLLLKARVDNTGGQLRPGAFARVELVLQVRRQAMVLPEEALVPGRKGYSVFVVQEGRARRREVTIGLRRPGLVEIRSGPEPGETVIRSGHISVSDGDRVKITEASES